MSKVLPSKSIHFKDLILFEDPNFILINKPPFLSTLEDRNSNQNVLLLAKQYNENCQVGHRLDKETSGIMALTKNEEAYKYFSRLLEQRAVAKMYHALVTGRHEIEEEEINKPIYTSSNRSRVDYQQGKPSNTLITTLEIFQHHTLLGCMPVTGRMHQIRVHLAALHMPICGDGLYGGEPVMLSAYKRNYKLSRDEDEKPMMTRFALHAFGLQFETPTGELVKVNAPYPKDFDVTIRQLKKNSH